MEPRHEPRLAPPRRPAPPGRAGRWSATSTALYRDLPALHERDCEAGGFEWLDADDADNSVIALAALRRRIRASRRSWSRNFTPVPRDGYRIGVPLPGLYREVLNTDAALYGGSDVGNMGGVTAAQRRRTAARSRSSLTLPPLATIILDRQPD